MKKLFFTLVFLFWAMPVLAAITYDNATVAHATETSNSFTVNHATAAGSNLAAFACVSIVSDTITINTPTYNSVAMTPIECVTDWGGTRTCLFGQVAPTTGTNAFAGSFSDYVDVWAVSIMTFQGVDQSTPFGTPTYNIGGGEFNEVDNWFEANTTVATAAGDWVASCLTLGTTGVTITNGASQDQRYDDDYGGLQTRGTTKTASGDTTMAYHWPEPDGYIYVTNYAVAIKIAGAAPPPAATVRRRAIIIQ